MVLPGIPVGCARRRKRTMFRHHFPYDFLLFCPASNKLLDLPQYDCALTTFFDPKYRKVNGLDNESWFWNAFAEPVKSAMPVQHFYPTINNQVQPHLLERLPTELLGIIIEHLLAEADRTQMPLERFRDVLALGISSPILYPRVLSSIDHSLKSTEVSWRGQKVAFFGFYSCYTDQHGEYYGICDDFWPPDVRTSPTSWTKCDGVVEHRFVQSLTNLERNWHEFSKEDEDAVKKDLARQWRYPQDRVWVLRNLSRRQIVRSDTLAAGQCAKTWRRAPMSLLTQLKRLWENAIDALAGRQRTWSDKAPMTLAQVFLIMTLYSSKGFVDPDERAFLFQDGPWSGHTFDLITLEDHEADMEKESCKTEQNIAPWVDVSTIIAQDVYHLRWCVQQYDKLIRYTTSWRKEVRFWGSIMKDRHLNRAWDQERQFRDEQPYLRSRRRG